MLKRELKINFKSFLVWSIIIIAMFLLVFLIYPSIISSQNMEQIDQMMKMFSEEMLKAFNMDIVSINTACGWFKTEGFVFIILIVGSYSAILGSNILLKEENNLTIEYLNSTPVSRTKIVLEKALAGLIYIVSLIVLISIFNYIGLLISGDVFHKEYWILSLSPILPSLVLYFLCLFISSFMKKTRKMFAISLGLVFINYIISILVALSDKVSFLKYFTVYTLADIRHIIETGTFNPLLLLITIILITLLLISTLVVYNKKELI